MDVPFWQFSKEATLPGLNPPLDSFPIANNAIGTDRAVSARFPNNGLMLTTATHDTLVGNLVAGAIVLTDSDQNVVRGNRTGVGVQVRSGDGNVLMGNVGP